MEAKFSLGQVVATPGAVEAMEDAGQSPMVFLARHLAGDWGDIHPGDVGLNDEALKTGSRLFSVYWTEKEVKLWVITEWDRSATTILLPEEY